MPLDPRLTGEERAVCAASCRELPYPDVATVMFTSGTTSAPKPVYLTSRQLGGERGRLGARARTRPERALALRDAARPRRRPLDPAALDALRDHRGPARALRHRGGAVRADGSRARRSRSSRWSRRCSRGCSTPASSDPPALRWALLGGGPIPRPLLERAERAGVPVAPTYGMTEGCSQIATFGVPLHGVELRLERR